MKKYRVDYVTANFIETIDNIDECLTREQLREIYCENSDLDVPWMEAGSNDSICLFDNETDELVSMFWYEDCDITQDQRFNWELEDKLHDQFCLSPGDIRYLREYLDYPSRIMEILTCVMSFDRAKAEAICKILREFK